MSDEELASQARKVVRADVVTRTFIVFVLLALVAGTGLLTVLTVENYHRGQENRDTLHLIKSCTTPGMPCFVAAQKQTAKAVTSINQVIILAAACAVGETGTTAQVELAIQNCVIQRLAVDNGKGSP